MPRTCKPSARRGRQRRAPHLLVEALETRALPNANLWAALVPSVPEVEGNDTLDAGAANDALTLRLVNVPNTAVIRAARAWGTVGNGAYGASDVDWYSFTVGPNPVSVTLTLSARNGSGFSGVLGLYNHDPDALLPSDPLDPTSAPNDPFDPLGYRQLTQAVGTAGGDTTLTWQLAPGTYYVAVSGAGNRYFHPFLADSGLAGLTGDYELSVVATDLQGTGPQILEVDPGPAMPVASGQVTELQHSPFVFRVDFSAPIDAASINSWDVELQYSLDGTFTDDGGTAFIMASTAHYSPTANELQVTPWSPLGAVPYYRLVLLGSQFPQLTYGSGAHFLGQDADHPDGQDFFFTYHIQGIEDHDPSAPADDTLAGAQPLGDMTNAGLRQLTGEVGGDVFYTFDPNSLFNPSNFGTPSLFAGQDVNMYRFTVSGASGSSYVLRAEVFAGRIGSPLDSGLALYRVVNLSSDPSRPDYQLQFITANDNTLNGMPASDGLGNSWLPLFGDSAVFAGLTPGEYVLAVSSGPNTPDPLLGNLPGSGGLPGPTGVYDPNTSHSGQLDPSVLARTTLGSYILNLEVEPNPGAPHVVSVATTDSVTPQPDGSVAPDALTPLLEGATLGAPPHFLVVQFDQAMNLELLAFQAYHQNTQYIVYPVYVSGTNGLDYYPRLVGYDPGTFRATFQLLDELPNGPNVLRLVGSLGLTNLGGTPLDGGGPFGMFDLHFTVQGSSVTGSGPVSFTGGSGTDSLSNPQNLGTLFPLQAQAGIQVVRDFSSSPASAPLDTADYYQFQVTQARQYNFILTGPAAALAASVTLYYGHTAIPTSTANLGTGVVVSAFLDPSLFPGGTFTVKVGDWTTGQAAGANYRLFISIGQQGANPTPLLVGPAPALRFRLAGGPGQPPVLPALPNAAPGIVPAATPGSDLPSLARLLPGSTSASGPVGGVRGPDESPAEGGALAASSQFTLIERLLLLTVLTPADAGAGSDFGGDAPAPLANWVNDQLGQLRSGWDRALDRLFGTAGWLNQPAERVPMPALAPDESVGQGLQEETLEGPDGGVFFDDGLPPSLVDELAYANALAVLTGGLNLVGDRRQRPKAGRARPRCDVV